MKKWRNTGTAALVGAFIMMIIEGIVGNQSESLRNAMLGLAKKDVKQRLLRKIYEALTFRHSKQKRIDTRTNNTMYTFF